MKPRPSFPIAAALTLLVLAAPRPAVASQLHVRGLLDVVAAQRGAAFDRNLLTRGDSPFDAYGMRVFGDVRLSNRVQVYSQVVLRDATTPYVDGAYIIATPLPAADLHVMAGKIPWAIGTYAPRAYSNRNPLIGAPMMYQYHTTLLWFDLPPTADALLATAGSGQGSVDYTGYPAGRGMPLVDDSYWDVGITVLGSRRPFEVAAGVVAGAPGWGSTSQDDNSGKSLLGRLGVAPFPGVRFGVSGSLGPYLHQSLNPVLPAGHSVNDYDQRLAMADLELLVGHAELRAEGARNTWETPTVGDLVTRSGYVELKLAHSSGAFVAGRLDVLKFGEIEDSSGARRPWDNDVKRYETGLGYRFDRDILAKAIVQRTLSEGANQSYYKDTLFAAQLSVAF